MNKNFSFAKTFLLFIIISMITISVLSFFFIVPKVKSSIVNLQTKEINEKMILAVNYLEQYINTQIIATKELSNIPTIKNGVMQSGLSIKNLEDTISIYNISNKKANIILLDILGDVIIEQGFTQYNKDLSDKNLKNLLEKKSQIDVNIIQKEKKILMQVAVPILYSNSIEGVIVTQVPFDIKEIFSLLKKDGSFFKLQQNDIKLNSRTLVKNNYHSRVNEDNFLIVENKIFDFKLSFLTPLKHLANEQQKIILNITSSIAISISISFLILFLIGRKIILNPYDILEETVRQRTSDLDIIQKVATIANSAESTDIIMKKALQEIKSFFNFNGYDILYKNDDLFTSEQPYNELEQGIKSIFSNNIKMYIDNIIHTDSISYVFQGENNQISQLLEQNNIKSCILVPITAYDNIHAVLVFFKNEINFDFDKELMLTLSTQLRRVLERAKTKDELKNQVFERTKELNEIKQRLDLAFKGAGDGAWDWNTKTNHMFYSERFQELLGYKKDELEDNFFEFENRLHPYDKEKVLSAINNHLNHKKPFDMEYRLKTKNGKWHWFRGRGHALWDKNKKHYRMAGSIQDIQNLKEKESQLELFAEIIKNSNDLVVITKANLKGPDGPKITFVNDALVKFTGYSKEEIIGKTPRIFQGEKTSKETIVEISKSLHNNKSFKGEILNYSKDNTPYWIELNIIPILNKKNKPKFFAAIERDVTERKNIENKLMEYAKELEMKQFFLEQSKEEAEVANKLKSEFLAVMSHEIRTPMNGIIGMSELLSETDLTEKQRQYLEKVISSSELLLSIINDILDFSKIESGKMEIHKNDFNLKKSMQDICSLIKVKCDKNVALEFNYNLDEENVSGDMIRINQIISNLLGNSAKFTKKGKIQLNIEKLGESEKQIFLKISITDTGIGISDKAKNNIFNVFTQADSSTTRKFGGTGLGLSISKQLVELMGGELCLKSELGKGSCFWFSISLDKSNNNIKHKQSDNYINKIKTINNKILIVDDNKINQQILSVMLKKLNIEYDIAEDGLQAIQMNNENNYHLVFMDIQMPNMGGIEATEQIRKSKNNNVTIIALTANALKGDSEKYMQAGMNDYMSKPFKKKELIEIINKWT